MAGSAQAFMSLEDELTKLYAPRLAKLAKATGASEFTGLALARARAVFLLAQRRAEARARTMRAEVLRQDDWIEKHLPGM